MEFCFSMKEEALEIGTLKSTVKNFKENLDKVNNLVSASNGCGASNSDKLIDNKVKEMEVYPNREKSLKSSRTWLLLQVN